MPNGNTLCAMGSWCQTAAGRWCNGCSPDLQGMLAADKRRPHALGVPNLFHLGARLGLVHSEHIPAISIKESRDPVVGDAVDMHRDFLQLLHRRTELGKILVGQVLEIHRDMDVGHAEAADACRLVRQSLLMTV